MEFIEFNERIKGLRNKGTSRRKVFQKVNIFGEKLRRSLQIVVTA